jgi:hypothetical protein
LSGSHSISRTLSPEITASRLSANACPPSLPPSLPPSPMGPKDKETRRSWRREGKERRLKRCLRVFTSWTVHRS